MTDKLKFEMHDNTALITIDNPAANTWDSDNLQALEQLIGELNANPDCYSLVITGAGEKFFSAGADLKMFADGDPQNADIIGRHFHAAFQALTNFRGFPLPRSMVMPWVAASNVQCHATSELLRHKRSWRFLKRQLDYSPAVWAPNTCPGSWEKAGQSA